MAYYTEKTPGRLVTINGVDYRYFGGTSYLGLSSHPGFQELLINNIRQFGTNHGASRLSNLRLGIYETTEKFLAGWAGSEAALTLSSGFLAGQLLAHFFSQSPYKLFYAPNVHSALVTGGNRVFTSYGELAEALKSHLRKEPKEVPVLFMDSIDSSGNGYPDFSGLVSLPIDRMILVVDDSHGLGIVGEGGGGVFRKLARMSPRELIVCASLGKALGLQGGVVFCSLEKKERFWSTPFFAGASPAPPAHMATLREAGELFSLQREKLVVNIRKFEETWHKRSGFNYLSGYPVITFSNPDHTRELEKHKILVTDFPYPSLQGSGMNGRIVLSAHHQPEDIELLAGILNSSIL